MYEGGGSNSSAEFKPPSYTEQGWKDFLGATEQIASQPYQQYQGPRVAAMNDVQNTAAQLGADRAINGAPDLNSARALVTKTNNGDFLDAAPGSHAHVTPGTNPLLGPNPYLEGVVSGTVEDMTSANRMGAQAGLDSLAALGGGWGGSAWQQASVANNAALAKEVAKATGQLRMQDYTKNQDLQENALNRGLDADKFNVTTQQGAFDSERNRQMTSADLASKLSQDDWTAIDKLMGIGDAYQANAQKGIDASVDEFNRQQSWPKEMLELFGNALSRASGQGGQTSTTTTGGAGSGVGTGAGLLATLAALLQ